MPDTVTSSRRFDVTFARCGSLRRREHRRRAGETPCGLLTKLGSLFHSPRLLLSRSTPLRPGQALTFGLLRFPKSLIGLERRAILTAAPSSPRFIRHWRRFGDDAIVAKVSKSTLLVRRKIKGTPKSPIGFWGKRKHNEAMSFFRVSEKTISGVCADEVAVNFSACTLL